MKTRQPATRESEKRKSDPRSIYPFSAIVGQDEMKLGLILNVIDPAIGGVLIMGHRGTGKSTAVRGLADLLPEIWIVRGCSYQCDPASEQGFCNECSRKVGSGEKLQRERGRIPVVDLPLGATEDRVCGTIDIERALKDGVKAFEPGLIARANRGFLYIDEVNLLEDHLVDLLLDVAATGRSKVERESISIEHPARFVLIGSGNPEEGELRPQLLDRFGLHVEVSTEEDLDQRVEIVERREAFEREPDRFCARFAAAQEQLRQGITRAKKNSAGVKIDRSLLRQIAQLCTELKIDGHRGELTITRAGRALAAFQGRKKVTEEEVKHVAAMALRHRLRRDALDETASTEQIQQALKGLFPEQQNSRGGRFDDIDGEGGASGLGPDLAGEENAIDDARAHRQSGSPTASRGSNSRPERSLPPVPEVPLPKIKLAERTRRERSQSRSSCQQNRYRENVKRVSYNFERGRYARALSLRKGGAIAIEATLRAAAIAHQLQGLLSSRLPAGDEDSRKFPAHALRYKQFTRKSGTLFIFAIDASGSMALSRIGQAKRLMLHLLRQSYIRRDHVAVIGFRGTTAEILLPPAGSILRAQRVLDSLSVGGGTPLSAGIACSLELVRRVRNREEEITLLVFTDGHANVPMRKVETVDRAQQRELIAKELTALGVKLRKTGVTTAVVDTQNGFVSDGHAQALAEQLGVAFVNCRNLQGIA